MTPKLYSQAGQDAWVLSLFPEGYKGTFLDVGCSHPVTINNTKALEELGWDGCCMDVDNVGELYKAHRTSNFIQADATKFSFCHRDTVDYLSLDIDDATFGALHNLISSGVKFKCATIEHDSYRRGQGSADDIRSLMLSKGYVMARKDVTHDGLPFEDWWIHPSMVKPKLWDHAFVINLKRRTDRWEHATKQLDLCGIQAERFEGYDANEFPPHEALPGLFYDGKPNGNMGCTASHRAILTLIAHGPWDRVLVLEDDFLPLHTDTRERIAALDPPPFDLLYLGGHYMEAPISRISPGFIQCAGMLTTSSYVITREHARRLAPYLTGVGPIDNLFSMFARKHTHLILQPRLFAQYTSKSDLCGETRDNVPCMSDTRHENMV